MGAGGKKKKGPSSKGAEGSGTAPLLQKQNSSALKLLAGKIEMQTGAPSKQRTATSESNSVFRDPMTVLLGMPTALDRLRMAAGGKEYQPALLEMFSKWEKLSWGDLAREKDGECALSVALLHFGDQPRIVRTLLANNADPNQILNASSRHRTTPFIEFIKATNRSDEVAESMLDVLLALDKSKHFAKGMGEMTPLMYACGNKNLSLPFLERLLQDPRILSTVHDLDEITRVPALFHAAKGGSLMMFNRLFAVASSDEKHMTDAGRHGILFYAALGGNVDIVWKVMREMEYDTNQKRDIRAGFILLAGMDDDATGKGLLKSLGVHPFDPVLVSPGISVPCPNTLIPEDEDLICEEPKKASRWSFFHRSRTQDDAKDGEGATEKGKEKASKSDGKAKGKPAKHKKPRKPKDDSSDSELEGGGGGMLKRSFSSKKNFGDATIALGDQAVTEVSAPPAEEPPQEEEKEKTEEDDKEKKKAEEKARKQAEKEEKERKKAEEKAAKEKRKAEEKAEKERLKKEKEKEKEKELTGQEHAKGGDGTGEHREKERKMSTMRRLSRSMSKSMDAMEDMGKKVTDIIGDKLNSDGANDETDLAVIALARFGLRRQVGDLIDSLVIHRDLKDLNTMEITYTLQGPGLDSRFDIQRVQEALEQVLTCPYPDIAMHSVTLSLMSEVRAKFNFLWRTAMDFILHSSLLFFVVVSGASFTAGAPNAFAVFMVYCLLLFNSLREVLEAVARYRSYFRELSSIYNLLTLATVFLGTMVMVSNGGVTLLSVGVFLSWLRFLQFLRLLPGQPGYQMAVILSMLQRTLSFSVILSLFMISFALSFFLLLAGSDDYATLPESVITLFRGMIGDMDFSSIAANWLAQIFYILFGLLVPVLMLNFLVALMSSVFEDTSPDELLTDRQRLMGKEIFRLATLKGDRRNAIFSQIFGERLDARFTFSGPAKSKDTTQQGRAPTSHDRQPHGHTVANIQSASSNLESIRVMHEKHDAHDAAIYDEVANLFRSIHSSALKAADLARSLSDTCEERQAYLTDTVELKVQAKLEQLQMERDALEERYEEMLEAQEEEEAARAAAEAEAAAAEEEEEEEDAD